MKNYEQSHAARPSIDFLIREAQAAASDDTVPMNEIVRRFKPLAERLAKSATGSPELRNDLMNAARLALVKAVRRHDPRYRAFPAFAERYMRGAVWREYHRWLPPALEEGEAPVVVLDPPPAEADRVLARLSPWGDGTVATAVSELTPPQRRIVHLRYAEDAPLERIAAETGTTGSAVSQRLGTIHRVVARAMAA